MNLKRWHPEVILLVALSLLTRFWNLFFPNSVVFDEVYFKEFAGHYLTGTYYFDIHPPLGKLILGGWAWLSHQSGSALVGSGPAVMLRVIPALAGALIIPVFYLILRQLNASRRVATLGATLLLLDNALLVESRLILIDSMLILFGLSAVSAYLASRRRKGTPRWLFLALAAFFAGLAASTKWTGLTALGVIGLFWLADIVLSRQALRANWQRRLAEATALVLIPLAVYFSTFAVHFALLPKSGPGDAFMPTRFQATLVGSQYYDPKVHLSTWEKFIDLNVALRQSEDSLKNATHPYGSKWYTWPTMQRPIYYWAGTVGTNSRQGNIYLIGNPLIWWGILVVLFITASSCINPGYRRRLKPYLWAIILLITAYLANFLPFANIPRVMFLYHYFFSFIYSLALAVLALGVLAGWMNRNSAFWDFPSRNSRRLYIGIIVVALVGFVYFLPLTYGTLMSPSQLKNHVWLPTWR